jgi:hypothetical protein
MGIVLAVKWMRLGLTLQALEKQVEELAKMKLSVNVVIQILGLLMHGINALGQVIPPAKQVWVAAAVSVVQGITAVMAHFVNTDGTSQNTQFVPKP